MVTCVEAIIEAFQELGGLALSSFIVIREELGA